MLHVPSWLEQCVLLYPRWLLRRFKCDSQAIAEHQKQQGQEMNECEQCRIAVGEGETSSTSLSGCKHYVGCGGQESSYPLSFRARTPTVIIHLTFGVSLLRQEEELEHGARHADGVWYENDNFNSHSRTRHHLHALFYYARIFVPYSTLLQRLQYSYCPSL